MAVVTHGSFDEGPIVLALPPVYEYAGITEEVDPVFSNWLATADFLTTDDLANAPDITSTGDITALDDITAGGDLRVVGDTALEGNVVITGTVSASNLSGTNTGDSAGHSGLVPYTGATTNVDLDTYTLSASHVYIDGTISASTEAVTKGWVEALVGEGIALQQSVLGFKANYAALPGSPTDGDRWITSDDGKIYEYVTSAWDAGTAPDAGWQVWSDEDAATYTFDGSSWVLMTATINHNDTLNIQGGSPGNYYHLDSTTKDKIDITYDDDVSDVTGLTQVGLGIITGSDGTQTAYIKLSWNANVDGNFDHYLVSYKKSDITGWGSSLVVNTNSITIEGLIAGIEYDFRVAAVNKQGIVSNWSAYITETMLNDTGVPADVVANDAIGGIQMVLVRWTANTTDADLSHYNIYRYTSDNSGASSVVGNTKGTRFSDTHTRLEVGTTYYYWIKAVDTSGNESANYSNEVHATTRNVEALDVAEIAADTVLITGDTYLSDWGGTGDSTRINGAVIETGSISTTALSFTVSTPENIVATLNASTEGIEITANLFDVSGATVFTAKEGGSYSSRRPGATDASRIEIYPESNPTIGMQITDQYARNAFKVEIGGTNVGDVTIGRYSEGQGILYDASEFKTIFKGDIYCTGGTMDGITEFKTGVVGSSVLTMLGANLFESYGASDSAVVNINYYGYNGGSSYFRNFAVYDGKGETLIYAQGSNSTTTIYGNLIIDSTGFTSTGYFKLPILSTTQIGYLTPSNGMLIFNDSIKRVVAYYNSAWNPL